MPVPKRRFIGAVAVLAVVFALLLPSLRPRPTPRYTVTDLGVLPGGTESYAYSINAQGVVCGFTRVGGRQRACIFDNGTVTALAVPPGTTDSVAVSVNGRGEAAGRMSLPTRQGAFVYRSGKLRDLGTVPGFNGSEGNAINDRGEVAGDLMSNPLPAGLSKERAFLDSHGIMINLGTLPGAYSCSAAAISSTGQVAGDCRSRLGGFHVVPFLYDPRQKTMTALPMPPSCFAGYAHAISGRGQVAGQITYNARLEYASHAALWSGGKLTDLGVPIGYEGAKAEGLNDRNAAVGECFRDTSMFQLFLKRYTGWDNSQAAYLWRNGQAQDLNTLISKDADWTLTEANSINNQGQIAGYGLHRGQERAFLLRPVR